MIGLLLNILHLLLFASHFFLFSGLVHALARLELTRGQQLVEVVKVEHLSILVHDCHRHNACLRVYLVHYHSHDNASRSIR
jgi:hypothetical protein